MKTKVGNFKADEGSYLTQMERDFRYKVVRPKTPPPRMSTAEWAEKRRCQELNLSTKGLQEGLKSSTKKLPLDYVEKRWEVIKWAEEEIVQPSVEVHNDYPNAFPYVQQAKRKAFITKQIAKRVVDRSVRRNPIQWVAIYNFLETL